MEPQSIALDRRSFARGLMATAFAGLALHSRHVSAAMLAEGRGYGAPVPDPAGILDLPPGFSYKIVSQFGQTMSDGRKVPNSADGMDCTTLADGRLCLMRNHELGPDELDYGACPVGTSGDAAAFDCYRSGGGEALPGGVSTIILDPETLAVDEQYLSLVGTIRNCSGGLTPWGSWLSCEEDVSRRSGKIGQDHGWVFEMPVAPGKLVSAEPIRAMGRFNHEAAVCDPKSGAIYMTEDRHESLFYRFLPAQAGALHKGGRLQSLAFVDPAQSADTRNWAGSRFAARGWAAVRWIDLDDVESPADDLRKRGARAGAAIFARGEGIHGGDGEIYFTCTSGGPARRGQIMRYRPSPAEGTAAEAGVPGQLQLFLESTDPDHFSFGDNLTIAPGGDLIVCEDRRGAKPDNWLRGVTPEGEVYPFARVTAQTKCAGVCFAPDGKTMFLNLYSPARTIAVRGPF
ncbi:alkaline phosphatase PhoX [Sphingopyxis sp.]|uniref:alkaline phosphatase PhoX n=1 Tax=Sphingopyxis sp. TaxID=1908224 RepID=UPI003D0F7C4E